MEPLLLASFKILRRHFFLPPAPYMLKNNTWNTWNRNFIFYRGPLQGSPAIFRMSDIINHNSLRRWIGYACFWVLSIFSISIYLLLYQKDHPARPLRDIKWYYLQVCQINMNSMTAPTSMLRIRTQLLIKWLRLNLC